MDFDDFKIPTLDIGTPPRELFVTLDYDRNLCTVEGEQTHLDTIIMLPDETTAPFMWRERWTEYSGPIPGKTERR